MPISSFDFQYLQKLVLSRSGVLLAEKERYLVEARLLPLSRQQKANSVSEFVTRTRSQNTTEHDDAILDALLPKDTTFFRDAHVFDLLRNQLLKTLEMKRSGEYRLRIWCAGCSSGQEAYSIAMLLHRYYSQLMNWDVEILATDLSTDALGKAQQGQFDEIEVHRGVQPFLIREYFLQDGASFSVKEDIARLVRFERLNLIDEWPSVPAADLVLLRNVLRYMSSEAKRQVLSRLTSVMKPDSYLFVGAQESIADSDGAFKMVPTDRAVYYQVAQANDRL